MPGQARLVKDILPPFDFIARLGPRPESLVEFRNKLFFAINPDEGRRGLWKSDGTEAGTLRVKAFPSREERFSGDVSDLTVLDDDRLFFVAATEAYGSELWVTNGTTRGTRRVTDLAPGAEDSFLSSLTATSRGLLFFRYLRGTADTSARYELWRSDGTEAGTVLLRDFGPESSTSTLRAVAGDTLYFILTTPELGTELWKTDGTEAGTGLVEDLVPGAGSSYPFDLRAVGDRLYFTAEDSEGERAIWRSDGTEAGTVHVEALEPGTATYSLRLLDVVKNHLYFTTEEASEQLLTLHKLKVSGSGEGRTKRVATLPNPYADEPEASPFVTQFAVAGRQLFFALGISTPGPAPRDVQLWVTDGTEEGTRLLYRPLSLSDEFGSELYAVDGHLVFTAFEQGTAGLEPWVTDGTEEGTCRLQDLVPGPESSYPLSYTRVGRQLFFVASDGTGNDVWVTPLQRSRRACVGASAGR